MKSFLQNEFLNFPHLILIGKLSRIILIKLCLFFLTLLIVFFFQFKTCIIYCFHVQFDFDFVLDILIVVYTPRTYFVEVKVNIYFL